jgi:type I restriction enzyme S subunit
MTTQLNGQGLPDGWVWVNVGCIVDVRTGATPLRSNLAYWQGGSIPWVTSGALNHLYIEQAEEYITPLAVTETNAKLFPSGSLLVAMYGEGKTRGKVSELKIDAATNQACAALVFDEATECLKPYIKLYFLKNYQDIRRQSSGGVQPNLNLSIIKQTQVPLAPLNEQQRIVAAIETQFTRLDAAVTALKRSQANLKRYRAAVLKAACEGRLVPTEAALAQAEGRAYEPAAALLDRILAERRRKWEAENPKKKYQEPVAPDTSALPELPEGWCWVSLDIIAQVRTGVAKGRKFDDQDVVSLPYLRVANVQDGYLDLSEIKTIEILANEIERYRLKPHDILFNEGGDRDKLGRGAIWSGDIKDCIHQNHVFAARLYTSAVAPKWVNFVRQLTYARDHFWKQASQTTNLASINSTNLRSLPIPIPTLDEQARIISEVERRLSLIDQLEKTIKTDLARANRLRQSILKRAFAGQLVPQDPNDEPASVLLERIQAAKHGQPAQAKLPL